MLFKIAFELEVNFARKSGIVIFKSTGSFTPIPKEIVLQILGGDPSLRGFRGI